MTVQLRPAETSSRARRFAVAAGIVLGAELVIAVLLAWPGAVPALYRPAWRTVHAGVSGAVLLVVVLLVIELLRASKIQVARSGLQVRQQAVFDALPNGLALWSAEDRLEQTNADFLRIYAPIARLLVPGARFEDVLRRAVQDGLVPEAAGREQAWIAQRLAQHRDPGAPVLRQLPDGRWRRIAEQRLADGRLLSHSIDVTDLITARAETETARRRLEDAIEALPAGFELFDADDRLIATNSVLRAMYPRVATLLQQPLAWEEIVRENHARGGLPEVDGDFEDWLRRRRAQRLALGSPHVQPLPGDRWVSVYERRTREGGIVGVRIDVSDVMHKERELQRLNAELDAANAELRRMAGTDPLTGIGNRRSFDTRLNDAWRAGEPLAMLMLDIDFFKRYNDHHGHPAGDAVLRRVAAVLVASLRAPDDLVARLGGEEFALLMSNADATSALSAAERCLALLAEADIAHGDSPIGPRVTASVGVAVRAALPADATVEALVALADAALYAAKLQGRNCARLGAARALPQC